MAFSSLLNCSVIMKINFLSFHRPPETFHKNVIIEPAAAIHADPNSSLLKSSGKLFAGKLSVLVLVKELRPGNPKNSF